MIYAGEPVGGVDWLPVRFRDSETAERISETNLDGMFAFEPPAPGWVLNVQANPFPFPLDLYGTKDIDGLDQLQYPPANMNNEYGQVFPLVFPEKYLHQILEWR